MSTIVKTIETFKQFVTVQFNFDFDTVLPYIKKQERKHIKSVIGRELYKEWATATPTSGVEKEVFELLQEASSHLALLSYTKVGIISISNAGFLISTSQDAKPAEWWQIKDLRTELLKSGTEAIDEALELMELQPEEFQKWKDSDNYTVFKELITGQTNQFQQYFNINKSRLTFLALRPHLLKVEKKYFKGLLGSETLLQLKSEETAEAKEALELCRAAQVPLCVAEVANEGVFELTAGGIFTSYDEIPGQKKSKAALLELDRLKRAKEVEGNEQLKELLNYLREHPTVFTDFAAKEKSQIQSTAINTKSIVSF
jgi:hypothetical protein